MSADRGEFAFIHRLAERLGAPPPGVTGIGDDAAVLADGTLAAIDTLVAERHFRLRWCEPEDVGWKALAVNLSDLAAMGGAPTAALAAVTIPPDVPGLADRVADGLIEASEAHACPLVGGDTTSGPALVLTVAVLGRIPQRACPVRRSGARAGESIFVTGTVGAAAAALDALGGGTTPDPAQAMALHRPVPRLDEGRVAAAAGASAMIDVSDGLVADLGHVLDASGVGAELWAAAVPHPPGVALHRALTGGDDYELCFTAPDCEAVTDTFRSAGLRPPTAVGVVTHDGRALVDEHGTRRPLPTAGWTHSVV